MATARSIRRARSTIAKVAGVESAKLLLMSASNRFPNGLANSNGVVGKNFMWDLGGQVSGLFDHPLNEYKSVQVTRVIHDYYAADPKRGCSVLERRGNQIQFHPRLLELSAHYHFAPKDPFPPNRRLRPQRP